MKKQMPLFLKCILALTGLGVAGYIALVGLVYHWEVTVPAPKNYDSIIVLGAQVLPSGEPSVQLRWRLDKAEEYYRKKPCPIVCCGAQGSNEPAPEGDVMAAFLIAEGADRNHVISESVSVNTRQNLTNAWKLLQERGCQKPLIVTSDYHLPRALALSRDLGMNPEGVGSPCRNEISFWLKNHCREALSWVKYWGEKILKL